MTRLEDTVKTIKQDTSDLETAIDDAEKSKINLKAEIEALDDETASNSPFWIWM